MANSSAFKTNIVISCRFVEKVVFPYFGGGFPRRLSSLEQTDEQREASRFSSFVRARSGLRRLIFSNAWNFSSSVGRSYPPVFLTQTYRDSVTDLGEGNFHFQQFVQRLNYQENLNLKYVTVPEFQQRGSVHHHTLFFNFPFVPLDRLRWIWGKGEQMNVQKLRSLRAAGDYLSKYLSKGRDDSRLFRKRRYSPSEGLFRPVVISEPSAVQSVLLRLPEMPETSLDFGVRYSSKLLDSPFPLFDFEKPVCYAENRILNNFDSGEMV